MTDKHTTFYMSIGMSTRPYQKYLSKLTPSEIGWAPKVCMLFIANILWKQEKHRTKLVERISCLPMGGSRQKEAVIDTNFGTTFNI